MQAFLDTTPEKGKLRRSNWSGGEPPIGALRYLSLYLIELGYVVASPNGLRPLNWQDIAAWQSVTQTDIKPWECKELINLSTAYIVQHHQSIKTDCISPYTGNIDHAALAARRRARTNK